MLGPTIAQRALYADVEVGVTIEFMERLEAMGPDPLLMLAAQMNSTAATERHFFLGDVPGFREWKDDRVMATLMAHRFSIDNKDWSSGIQIHRNEILDDKLGLVQPRIATLAEKAARHKGKVMIDTLINGFAGAFPDQGDGKGYDGQYFFSNSHSLEGGATIDNLNGSTALSDVTLEAAELLFANMTTWDGKEPLEMQGTHLIVGPKNEKLARSLVGSSLVLDGTGVAAVSNPYFMGKYQVVVSRRLVGTYDDYWFLADLSKATKPFIVQDREPITTAAQTDWSSPDMFRRGIMNFGAQARYGIGLYDFRCIVGTPVA